MPIYEYECDAGHTFEVLQSIGQMDNISPCKYCDGRAHRILSPANFVLKGPGFYVNDYKNKAESPKSSPGEEKAKPEKPEKGQKGNGKDS